MTWHSLASLTSTSFTCGYCNNQIASDQGYFRRDNSSKILVCHSCQHPTYFDRGGKQTPGVKYGPKVENITDKNVESLLDEAKGCFSIGAFTASILCCRKILMHVGVDKGASQGLSFIRYVEYLSEQNYIPSGSKGWVDYIRTKSNELNHEIVLGSKDDASKLLDFTCMLLKVIYEFPSSIPS